MLITVCLRTSVDTIKGYRELDDTSRIEYIIQSPSFLIHYDLSRYHTRITLVPVVVDYSKLYGDNVGKRGFYSD